MKASDLIIPASPRHRDLHLQLEDRQPVPDQETGIFQIVRGKEGPGDRVTLSRGLRQIDAPARHRRNILPKIFEV